MTLGNKKYTGK